MSTTLGKGHEVGLSFAAQDALDHTTFASRIVDDLIDMPPGSVISVQGAWGRGKTDVVARAYDLVRRRPAHPTPLWINPWQYGTPDLIRPLVLEILRRLATGRRDWSERLRRAARTLLRAGNAMLFKAVSVVAPVGDIIAAGEKEVDNLLAGLLQDRDQSTTDPDPVFAMALRFRELVAEYLAASGNPDGRLVVCVDDLDRCLPDHQIAMLEAIHFLTGARAACSFLIALDPALVKQAAQAHYRTQGFDSEQYLNKLFDLRLNLPAVTENNIGDLVRSELEHPFPPGGSNLRHEFMASAFGVDSQVIIDAFGEIDMFPELCNPRLLRRIVERMTLLCRRVTEAGDDRLSGPAHTRATINWCALAERWPTVRHNLQLIPMVASWRPNIELYCYHYKTYQLALFENSKQELEDALALHFNVIARLPDRSQVPDLGSFLLNQFLSSSGIPPTTAYLVDRIMVEYGL
jgi:hypothetical protein